jgi:hypothetical protein
MLNDLEMPNDFDVKLYETINERIDTWREAHPDSWKQYIGAWTAVAYRFLTCTEHDEAFTESIGKHGNTPPQPVRYIQERELLGFFVSGLASIESFCYALFFIGSILNSQVFPILQEKRSITVKSVLSKYRCAYRNESIIRALCDMMNSSEYSEWNGIRNILCHRLAPGRIIYAGGPDDGKVILDNDVMENPQINIDENTTAIRRIWLAETMNKLLQALDKFTLNNHP